MVASPRNAGMGVRQAFTSYSNPKGNSDTERFLRTLKEELVWLHEWTSPAVFFAVRVRRRPPCVRGEAREDRPCDGSCNGL